MSQDDKCFACDRPFRGARRPRWAWTIDGQGVFVGPDCHRRIVAAGAAGYQPPKGGPVLLRARPGLEVFPRRSETQKS